MADDKEKKNIKALAEFRLKGKKVQEGEVVAKTAFADKGDWQNLCNMKPTRAEETSDAVGKPKPKVKDEANKAAMPGSTK